MGLKDKVLVAWHNCGFVQVPRHYGKQPTVSKILDAAECCWCDCDNPGLVYIHEEDEPCYCDCHLESMKDRPKEKE